MSMNTPVRWGIVGTGWVARVFADDLAEVAGATLTAVASRTVEGAESFAAGYEGVRAFPDLASLLASGEVDVLYVCTPPHRHADDCVQSLTAGVPVLCEKPFAADAPSALRVVELARRTGLFCMEAMWMRFLPAVRDLDEMVRSGAIGEPRILMVDFGMANAFDPTHRLFDPARGGGALLDRGVYAVALAVMLFGAPDAVTSLRATVPTGVDGDAGVLLRFPGERLAVVTCSLTSWTSNVAAVSGTAGRLVLQAPFHRSERITLSRYAPMELQPPRDADGPRRRDTLRQWAKEGPAGRPLRWVKRSTMRRPLVSAATALVRSSADESFARPIDGVGYGYEAAEVVRCLRAGRSESPAMTLDETLLIMQIMDEARGQWAGDVP
jgi:predicted dehydrogenase